MQAARKWGPQAAAVTQGTPCVPLPRFPVPHPIYRPAMVPPPPSTTKLAQLHLELQAHPVINNLAIYMHALLCVLNIYAKTMQSKESIDAAIGDVLVKPWLPLPLGLKPPSLDSVMSELHKQGVPKIPPAAATTAGTG